MLRTKIAISIFIFLFIVGLGLMLHTEMQQKRLTYFMWPPVTDSSFRMKKTESYHMNRSIEQYSPFLPREYVKIIHKNIEQEQIFFDK
ncbi:hypothetical protein I6N90_16190 [Paenibacillus sp. GSMTC-2017]|uniref:hypothetical protein n=1 Tax=Paenibacillus sp. GSMTC-2017 TaxID=2794350 RepID=UPI0018D72190|nr:hypothetical protein [Paenibacillus sp. GSMTC-2017]MBH5319340.1 hypothetical protein [Paenibacillus sp. GSMTC-2017]